MKKAQVPDVVFFLIIKFAAAAEKYMNESLATCQMIHGPHHKQTLLVQDELARLYIRTDRNAVSYLIVISFLGGRFLCSFRTFLAMVCFIQVFCKYYAL